eukprot:674118-Ditylum_brightwellii.AAC.1
MGMAATAVQQHQQHYYQLIGSNRSSFKWASEISLMFIQITHNCWRKRCRLKHDNSPDYLTIKDFTQGHQSLWDEYSQGING